MLTKSKPKPLGKPLASLGGSEKKPSEIVMDGKPRPKNERVEKKPSKMSQAKLRERADKIVEKANKIDAEYADLGMVAAGSEAVFLSEYEKMLRTNAGLIRRFHEQLQGNLTSRDVYALSTLMSQQREVIADLRTLTDMSKQVGMIYDQALTPFISEVTQMVTDVYYQLRKLIMESTRPNDTPFALSQLDELVKQLGLGLQRSHGQVRGQVESILIGGAQPATPSKNVKTKKH